MFGGVIKYDSSGSLLMNKVFAFSKSGNPVDLKYFICKEISQYDDSHIILTGGVQYAQSSLGLSTFSTTDRIMFKADYDFNITWASIFDYKGNPDSTSNCVVYNSLIYTASYVSYVYPYFYYINGTDGHYMASNLFLYYSLSSTKSTDIKTHVVTEKYVFGIDNRSMITGTKTILFILDSQTLHYVKAYSILNTVNVFCLNCSFEAEKIKFLIQGPNRVYFVTIDSDMTYTLQAGLFRTDNNTEAFFVQDLILKNSSQVNLKYIYAHFLFQLAYNGLSIYYNLNLTKSVNNITAFMNAIIRTDENFSQDNCSAIYLEQTEMTQNDITLAEIIYTPNGTNPTELHSFNDSSLDFLYLSNFDLFHDLTYFANYSEFDITSCVWPGYSAQVNICTPQLPIFVLDEKNNIKFGTNLQYNLTLIPFEHCQDARFIIRVCLNNPNEDGFCDPPLWMIVDQLESSISIDFSAILLAGNYTLTFQSQLLVDAKDSINTSLYTTTSISLFYLENSNCELASNLEDWYIVLNLFKNYTVSFNDKENDQIMIKIIDDGGLNIAVHSINNKSFDFEIQCRNIVIKSAQLSFNYTDKYHTDPYSWIAVNIIVNVYASEPPRFVDPIQDIVRGTCFPQQYIQELPNITDPDSTSFTSSFGNEAPSWMKIIDNIQIDINITSSDAYSNLKVYQETLILTDDSNSSTKYPVTVIFEDIDTIEFSQIKNISVAIGDSNQININLGYHSFIAKTCDGQKIDWICYSSVSKSVLIFDEQHCNYTIDYCDVSNLIGDHCIQLYSENYCKNIVSSNKFTLTILPAYPASVLNSLNSVYVYPYYYTEILIPRDLFYNSAHHAVTLQPGNCIDNSESIGFRISSDDQGNIIMLIEAFGYKGCKVSLTGNSPYCQSSEILFDVVVLKCASKDCTKCKGQNQNDCLMCRQGYVLNIDGVCLAQSGFAFQTGTTILYVLGAFSMITISINILLFFIYGKMMLEPIVHAQAIMMLVMSSSSVDKYWYEYLQWIQYFKFDFSFISYYIVDNLGVCTPSSGKLFNLKMYYEETICNYFAVIMLITIVMLTVILLKRFCKQVLSKIKTLCSNNLLDVDIFWILWFIFLPFLVINIYYDLVTIRHHLVLSCCLIVVCLCTAVWLMKMKLSFLSPKFIKNLCLFSPIYYLYILMFERILYVLLFISEITPYSQILAISIFVMQNILLFNRMNICEGFKHTNSFEQQTCIICNYQKYFMKIAIMIASVGKIFVMPKVNVDQANHSKFGYCIVFTTVLLFCAMLLTSQLIIIAKILIDIKRYFNLVSK